MHQNKCQTLCSKLTLSWSRQQTPVAKSYLPSAEEHNASLTRNCDMVHDLIIALHRLLMLETYSAKKISLLQFVGGTNAPKPQLKPFQ